MGTDHCASQRVEPWLGTRVVYNVPLTRAYLSVTHPTLDAPFQATARVCTHTLSLGQASQIVSLDLQAAVSGTHSR